MGEPITHFNNLLIFIPLSFDDTDTEAYAAAQSFFFSFFYETFHYTNTGLFLYKQILSSKSFAGIS